MTNLTEQDLRRIETIEGYLRQLDICNPEYSLPQFKPYQPIDTTEGEQEQGKEWKEGEWITAPDIKHPVLIEKVLDKTYYCPEVNGGGGYYVQKQQALPVTKEQVEQFLVAIAENKYPVGTKFKDGNDKQFEISETEFDYDNRGNALFGRCYEFSGWIRIWHNGKWAEIVAPIETEETKEFTYNTFVQHDSIDGYAVIITVSTQSKETAYKKLDAIKQYLSTNKF